MINPYDNSIRHEIQETGIKCFTYSISLAVHAVAIKRNIQPVEGLLKMSKSGRGLYFFRKRKDNKGYVSTAVSYYGNGYSPLNCFETYEECLNAYLTELRNSKKLISERLQSVRNELNQIDIIEKSLTPKL